MVALATQQRTLQSCMDKALEGISHLTAKLGNLEAHRLFKDPSGSAMSGIALTTAVSRIVSENDQMRADVMDREDKIVSLKEKLNDSRKKNEVSCPLPTPPPQRQSCTKFFFNS